MKRIALAQMNIEYGAFQRNTDLAMDYISKAVDEKCDLILFPELWSTGFDLAPIQEYDEKNQILINQLQQYADQHNIAICGTYIQKQEDSYFNSFNFLQPQKPARIYNKNHLFKMMHEDKYFSAGMGSVPFTSVIGKTGLGICFDLRFPEFFLELTMRGAEVFLLSSHWPLSRISHWDILLQARAIENQAYMIAANSVGQSGKDIYGGHSSVITPDGQILVQGSSTEESLYIVDIDPDLPGIIRNNFVLRG